MSSLSSIMQESKFKSDGLVSFEKKLFFDGDRRGPFLVRYTVLLFLATVIASGGIIADSTATVIGAMIIAPLMIPIMATAAAFVMGNMVRAFRSMLLVGAGVALVIAVSWLIGNLHSVTISYTTHTQIIGRISPTITDLIVALAAGAAGAFAMSRDDIVDSLPGVAISISLVPPLCVAGISMSDGQWEAALGAIVLFLTNFLSIVLAGGGVLALLGLGRVATRGLVGTVRRNAFLVVALGLLLVSVPLVISSARVARETRIEFQVAAAAKEWASQSGYEVRRVNAKNDVVIVQIAGEGEPPQTADLVSAVQNKIQRPVSLEVESDSVEIERVDVLPTDE